MVDTPLRASSHQHSPQPFEVISNHTESLLVEELNRLTIQERDNVLHDVHGVCDVKQEDGDQVHSCFGQVEDAISRLPQHKKSGYLQARDLDPFYVTKQDFILMFLRANSFDVEAAAAAIVDYFDTKLDLFGPDKLVKDIDYADLDPSDQICLETGYAQVLPGRDRAGRAIFFITTNHESTPLNRQRVIFFVLMQALQDPETQQLGVVGIIFHVGNKMYSQSKDRGAVWNIARAIAAPPVNYKCVHLCYDNEDLKLLSFVAIMHWARNTRVRCRLHEGSMMESIYHLMTFGMPAEILPFSPSGEPQTEANDDFCRRMKKASEVEDDIMRIVVPGRFDVLWGKGALLQSHFGDMRYEELLDEHLTRFASASELERINISNAIVLEIQAGGGRFLQKDEIGWVEVDDAMARYGVSQELARRCPSISLPLLPSPPPLPVIEQPQQFFHPPSFDLAPVNEVEEPPPYHFPDEVLLAALNSYDRRAKDCKYGKDEPVSNKVVVPAKMDVLLGRGKPLQKHPGNLRYHYIIESYHPQYDVAQKLEKTNLSKAIVEEVKGYGGRFLKQSDAGWVEVDDETARYKVSHTFRNHRIAARQQEKKNGSEESETAGDTENGDAPNEGGDSKSYIFMPDKANPQKKKRKTVKP
eukprot:Nitzschia sp. Nitz4//scaffold29_size155292//59278//61341//NITZ4_002653-RA/size155292-processed-gene-0.13-mRNA-1//1//CDS//3329546433//2580//frame0